MKFQNTNSQFTITPGKHSLNCQTKCFQLCKELQFHLQIHKWDWDFTTQKFDLRLMMREMKNNVRSQRPTGSCVTKAMKLILRVWSKCLTTCLICLLFCIIWQQIITMWLSRRLSPRQSSTWQPAKVNLRNGLPHLKVKIQPQKRLVSQATKACARWSEYM